VSGEGGARGSDGDDNAHPDSATETGASEEKSSFSDLLGDVKPLDRGPPRLAPASARAPVKRRDSPDDGGASSQKFRWPDPSDRHRAAAEGVTDSQLTALARGESEPLERIDLHGTRADVARRLLAKRLESACSQGLDCVIVIHGRGQHSASGVAVLRDALPGWLTTGANARDVLAFTPAPDRLGGLGATLVLLRRR